MLVDNIGLYGSVMHYALTIAFTCSAFLLLLYFWKRGRLDFDEEPKWQMLQDHDKEEK